MAMALPPALRKAISDRLDRIEWRARQAAGPSQPIRIFACSAGGAIAPIGDHATGDGSGIAVIMIPSGSFVASEREQVRPQSPEAYAAQTEAAEQAYLAGAAQAAAAGLPCPDFIPPPMVSRLALVSAPTPPPPKIKPLPVLTVVPQQPKPKPSKAELAEAAFNRRYGIEM